MFTIIVNQQSLEKISQAKISYKRFSILKYIQSTFRSLPSNVRMNILKSILNMYGIKIDYNSESIFFNVNNENSTLQLHQDLISENVTTAELELVTKQEA